jgi:hypothetical protein
MLDAETGTTAEPGRNQAMPGQPACALPAVLRMECALTEPKLFLTAKMFAKETGYSPNTISDLCRTYGVVPRVKAKTPYLANIFERKDLEMMLERHRRKTIGKSGGPRFGNAAQLKGVTRG